jgi:ABC-type glutathione transport system ATPase component
MSDQNIHPLLRAESLVKRFGNSKLTGSREGVLALDGVSLSIYSGTTLAVVGESGSGKSTLAFCLACLERPTSGSIWFGGNDLAKLTEADLRGPRRQVQLIFQDPVSSLNPRFTALDILTEPFVVQSKFNRNEMKQRAQDLLERVGLSAEMGDRTPADFSGGQRQRLAIARALALEPKVLVLDEALSGLDCSVQAQIANLLMGMQAALGMTYLFITHDLTMAAHLADEIAVMDHGRIVEQGRPQEVLEQPRHRTTMQLVAAMPKFDAGAHAVWEQ